jgi:hypothetical protein
VGDERVELNERARIEQQGQPFSRGQLATSVLLLDSRRSPTLVRLLPQCQQASHPVIVRQRHIVPPLPATDCHDDRVFAQGRRAS